MKRLFITLLFIGSSAYAMDANQSVDSKTKAIAEILAPRVLEGTTASSFIKEAVALSIAAKVAGAVTTTCAYVPPVPTVLIGCVGWTPPIGTIILTGFAATLAIKGGKYLYDRYTTPASEQQ